MGEIETKVILQIDHIRLIVRFSTAVKIMELLIEENLQIAQDDYTKDPATGEYKTIQKIRHMGTEQLTLKYLSHTEYLMRCANGDKDAS